MLCVRVLCVRVLPREQSRRERSRVGAKGEQTRAACWQRRCWRLLFLSLGGGEGGWTARRAQCGALSSSSEQKRCVWAGGRCAAVCVCCGVFVLFFLLLGLVVKKQGEEAVGNTARAATGGARSAEGWGERRSVFFGSVLTRGGRGEAGREGSNNVCV